MTDEPRALLLDLNRYHFRKEIGPITLWGTWVANDHGGAEPALVLGPTERIRRCREGLEERSWTPFVIRLREAHELVPTDPDYRGYLFALAHEIGQGLGLGFSRALGIQIMTLIHDHLGDLIAIPPAPDGVVAEFEGTIEGRRVSGGITGVFG